MPPDRELTDASPGEPPSHGDVQQLVEAERGDGEQGVRRTWLASDSALIVLTSDTNGVRISGDNGTTPPAALIVNGTPAGGALAGTFPNPTLAPSPTITGPVTINGALTVTGLTTLQANATVGGTFGVTGAATVGGTLGVTSTATVGGLTVTTNATVNGNTTLNGNAGVGGTFTVAGLTTTNALDVNGDLHLAGSATLGNAASDAIHIPGTLLVVGETELQGDLAHTGTFLGVFNTAPTTKKTVTGSRGSNAALANLCTALAAYGLIVNNTS